MQDSNARAQALLARMRRSDGDLAKEIETRTKVPEMAFEAVGGAAAAPTFDLETIVRQTGRPVLRVFEDEVKLEFDDASSKIWRDRLKAARKRLVPAIRAVGRIELSNYPTAQWVGTGWLVAEDVIVTNRHVASIFGRKKGDAFVFRQSPMGLIGATIDFLEEFGNDASNEMALKEILYIEDGDDPDLAFLRVEPSGAGKLADPILLSTRTAEADQFVAVIGYPARDSRIPDQDLMLKTFGDVFDKKRLAPGQLMTISNTVVQHDCSTLGGNSGSVVLDLDTGEAVGLHHAGTYLTANFAVPAAVVAERLSHVRRGTRPAPVEAVPAVDQQTPTPQVQAAPAAGTQSLSCVIPIHINIEVGAPEFGSRITATAAPAPTGGVLDAEEAAIQLEGKVEDYSNRKGFDTGFLGSGITVPLPKIVKEASQIVTDLDGESVLKYQHFSVVMHRKRRMCFYSAVNLDGKLSKRTVRSNWHFDPRIDQALQIKGECYGNPPKYSRGHMTRREDPAWGKTQDDADLGCDDSMHVTNTVPQMQSFNGGVWLSLEDYALKNAREDDQRICVITGPFFTNADPIQFGIKIPKAFWKVIAFVHDKTKKLTATGYSISQEEHIPNTEFVFGEFGAHQRSLKWIESKAGISLGALTTHDPMNTADEAAEAISLPLRGLDDIQF